MRHLDLPMPKRTLMFTNGRKTKERQKTSENESIKFLEGTVYASSKI